jgi:glutathione S-transferase
MTTSPRLHVLYYTPSVCSLAPHIVLHELAIPFETIRVDLRTHTTADGTALHRVSPKDCVPVLALPDETILTETAVILLYLADLYPERGLAPPPGSRERLRFHEQLSFIATELHKGFAPFTIMASPSEDSRRWAAARLAARVAILDTALGEQPFLTGAGFTALDAYAYWALGTCVSRVKLELTARLHGYLARVGDRPSVRAARQAEALV